MFLISRTVRRDCLDMFFMCNKFVYTSFAALLEFTSKFRKSSLCIQNIGLRLALSDAPSSWHSVWAAAARQHLANLKTVGLDATGYPSHILGSLNESDLIMPLASFALGEAVRVDGMKKSSNSPDFTKEVSPITPTVGFECTIHFEAQHEVTDYISKTCHRIEMYLQDVFAQAGKSYQRLSQVPKLRSLNPWTKRARSPSPQGLGRRGMLIMGD